MPLLLTIALPLGACGGERAAQPVEAPSSAATAGTAPPPASPVPATGPQKVTPGPDVTVLPDGSAVLGPRVGDVAMLRRMPDGTFKRVCGPPDPETRDMLQGMMRARRRAK